MSYPNPVEPEQKYPEDDFVPLSKNEHLQVALEKAHYAGVPTALIAEVIIGVFGDTGARNLATSILNRI